MRPEIGNRIQNPDATNNKYDAISSSSSVMQFLVNFGNLLIACADLAIHKFKLT